MPHEDGRDDFTSGVTGAPLFNAAGEWVERGCRIARLLRGHAKLVEEDQNLWINSASWFHDVRRRHVAAVVEEMLGTLGYAKLG